MINYSKKYYQEIRQSEDRIALGFYYRLATAYVGSGRVLDYGCGTGHLIKRFERGYETWAYDISQYAIDAVHPNAPHTKVCSDISCIEKNKFDLILALHVLEHIEDPLEAILFFYKILNERSWGHIFIYHLTIDIGGHDR